MKRYGVIFDMDGVLVDSYKAHFRSWQKLGRKHGLEMTEETFAATFGRTSRDIIRQLWPGKATDQDIADWDADKEAIYREELTLDFPAMKGASELVGALHEAGVEMAIGSSGPPENVAVILRCLPNARHIAATVDGTQVGHGKPHPEVFLTAAGKLGIAPQSCAVIEDAPAGVEAAVRAGMAAVALTGTAPREKLAHAHKIVESLTELSPRELMRLIDTRA